VTRLCGEVSAALFANPSNGTATREPRTALSTVATAVLDLTGRGAERLVAVGAYKREPLDLAGVGAWARTVPRTWCDGRLDEIATVTDGTGQRHGRTLSRHQAYSLVSGPDGVSRAGSLRANYTAWRVA
jgi:hypothetical protein